MHFVSRLLSIALTIGLCNTPATAQNTAQKLDPGLKMIVNAIQRDIPNGILQKAAGANLPFIHVLIKGQPSGIRSAILNAGGNVEAIVDNVVSARIAPVAIWAIASSPAVERMEKISQKSLRNDEAAKQVGATAIQTGTSPLTQAYTGKGVIMGVIDSGIDFRHKDFRDPTDPSKSRILYIWDQEDKTGPPPEGYSYGTLWTKEQLEQDFRGELTVKQNDPNGHGTHVAGSAAGNGSAIGKYKGTAPESEIIFVKGLQNAVDAATFIYSKAEALGKPAVINYSAGNHSGAHDGTSLEEITLEKLATVPGRAFVTAAGNEGADFIHWTSSIGTDSLWTYYMANITAKMEPNPSGGLLSKIEINGVIAESKIENTFIAIGIDTTSIAGSVVTPLGRRGKTPWYSLKTLLELSGSSSDTLRYGNNDIAGIVGFTAYTTENKKVLLTLSIIDFVSSQDPSGFDAVGADLWRFMVRGNGTIHLWSEKFWSAENPSVKLQVTDSHYRPTDNNYTVGMPATATKLISVGAYTNIAVKGESAVHGALAGFSSKGPTADGRNKPDIVSPGQFVYSALSTASTVSDPATVDEKGLHYREQGTSMASPITAGSVALYLQKNPKATYDEIFSTLTKNAKQDNFTTSNGALPNNFWGYGKFDIFKAITAGSAGSTTPTIPTDPIVRADFSGNGTVGFEDFLTFASAFGSKTGGAKYDLRIDMDSDGTVGFTDFLIFASAFGKRTSG